MTPFINLINASCDLCTFNPFHFQFASCLVQIINYLIQVHFQVLCLSIFKNFPKVYICLVFNKRCTSNKDYACSMMS